LCWFSFLFTPLTKGQDIKSKYDLLLKSKVELTQEESEKAEKIMKEITMDEMSLVVEQKVLRQIDRVTNKKKNSLEKKYEEAYLKAHIDLYKKVVKKIGKTKKINEVDSKYFEDMMKQTLIEDKYMTDLITFTGKKLGENTLIGSYNKNNQLLSFLRIQNSYAAGGNCDDDNRWPKFARAERKSGLRYTATGISRVKNDPNENPCDYRVHFNARQWVTADGYDWIDFSLMVRHNGGPSYSQSGDRVLIGHGSATAAGNFNEWAVRHGIVMRNW
jgi:hypothetical protein